ncbi:hypothetical protein L5515_001259 [Caenorhabditis briggsae]|uniref:SPK domain-containing protein n=1 Tax=Caenorhabditis briggsae TaxID=6238 RepID=A0AAE9E437_CAEBR|nr:hypothetical protein L5515_001259 [Caenorhabditis briggsae]
MVPNGGLDPLNMRLLKFLAEKTEHATTPQAIEPLFKLFAEAEKQKKSTRFYRGRYHDHLSHRIHQIDELDLDVKVKLLFAFSLRVDAYFVQELKKNAVVLLDERGRITYYKNTSGGLELARDPPKGVTKAERDRKIMKFIVEKAEKSTTPLGADALAKESIGKEIWSSLEYDKPKRIKLMFVTGASFDEEAVDELRNDAKANFDNQRRLTKYSANDGTLELEGMLSPENERKKPPAPRKPRRKFKRPNSEDSEPESPVKRTRKSAPSNRRYLKSTSELLDEEPRGSENQCEGIFEFPTKPQIDKGEKWIPATTVQTTLDFSLLFVEWNTGTDDERGSGDETTSSSTSLKRFLSVLRSSLLSLPNVSLKHVHDKLKKDIKQLEEHDKIISIQTISIVLDNYYMMVSKS